MKTLKFRQHLAKEVLERIKVDQIMRKKFIAGKVEWDKKIDKNNTVWLKKIITQYGWPTISMVGKKASDGAWLLVQHADHDVQFQKKVLKMMIEMQKINKKEINPANIAYLTDRILIHQKRLQIFGTQYTRKTKKEDFKPLPIKDKNDINERRKIYGLSTLEENTKRINKEYKKLKR